MPVTIASGIAGKPPPEPISTSEPLTRSRIEMLSRICGANSASLFAPVRLNLRFVSRTSSPYRTSRSSHCGSTAGSRSDRSVGSITMYVKSEDRDVGGRHARNPACRSERARALCAQFFARFERECPDDRIVQRFRNCEPFRARSLFNRDFLAPYISGNFDFDRRALTEFIIDRRFKPLAHIAVVERWTTQCIRE